jgi:hypothetical protein
MNRQEDFKNWKGFAREDLLRGTSEVFAMSRLAVRN